MSEDVSEDDFGDSSDTDRDDEMFSRRERASRDRSGRSGRPGVSDFVRRAIENTVESVQSKGSSPREAVQFLLQQGDRGRREVLRIVAREVGEFMQEVNLSSEVLKILSALQVDVKASVRFQQRDADSLRAEVDDDSEVALSFDDDSKDGSDARTRDLDFGAEPEDPNAP